MNTQSPWLLIGGALLAIIIVLISMFGGSGDEDLDRRLLRVGGQKVEKKAAKQKVQVSVRRVTTDSGIPFLDRLIKALMPNPDKLRARLNRTGRAITLSEYLLLNLLLIFVAYLIFTLIVHWAKPSSLFIGIAIGLYLPHMVTGRLGKRRLKKFIASFPEAIDTMGRGLRSGLPVTESIASVGREMPDPVGLEFRRISDGVRMGRSLEEAMWEVARRLDSPEFRFLIISMAIQKETGGNLAETLGNLAELIRKRRTLRLKIKAMSSEARASAMIIGSLPFVMFTLLYFVNPDYVMTLFHTAKGNFLLAFGLGMITLGWTVMNKMIAFEI